MLITMFCFAFVSFVARGLLTFTTLGFAIVVVIKKNIKRMKRISFKESVNNSVSCLCFFLSFIREIYLVGSWSTSKKSKAAASILLEVFSICVFKKLQAK